MIYWAKRRCDPGEEIPFMKLVGDLQLKLGAPRSCSPYSRDLPKSKKTNFPISLSRSSSERTNSMNAFQQLRPRNHDHPAGKNRIMIYGPKFDGTYIIEFKTAEGEALAISIPRSETAVIRHFQERMCRMEEVP
jgi:hypothetical protein